MNISKIDLIKYTGWAIALLSGLIGVAGSVLQPWGVNSAEVAVISARISSIIIVLTLIYSTMKRPTPDHLEPVFSSTTAPTTASITTLPQDKAEKAKP